MKDYADKSWYRNSEGKLRVSVITDWVVAAVSGAGLAYLLFLGV